MSADQRGSVSEPLLERLLLGVVGLYVLVRADGGPLRARRRHILLDGGDGSQVPPGDARAASRPLLLGRLLEAHFLVVRDADEMQTRCSRDAAACWKL